MLRQACPERQSKGSARTVVSEKIAHTHPVTLSLAKGGHTVWNLREHRTWLFPCSGLRSRLVNDICGSYLPEEKAAARRSKRRSARSYGKSEGRVIGRSLPTRTSSIACV